MQDTTTIRQYTESDWTRIKEIIEKHDFEIPHRKNVVTEATVTNRNGNIVAYGMVKAFAEAVIILDPDAESKDKISSLSQLMRQAIHHSHLAGFDQVHGFFKNKDFANSMKKHYGFKEPFGECLVLEID